MELTFGQQVVLAVVGGVAASILTNGLSYLILRDQWKREKEERLEQWRREQETRRRQWKREYRKELLRPFLEKVRRIVAVLNFLQVESYTRRPEMVANMNDKYTQLIEEISSIGAPGVEDETFLGLYLDFMQVLKVEETAKGSQLEMISGKLHKWAEEWLEETFD
jgi:hypothetical protein